MRDRLREVKRAGKRGLERWRLADRLDEPEWETRAVEMGDWEVAIQLDCGAVMGGKVNPDPTPAVFNTHDITSQDPTLRGGVPGSWPVWGEYGRFLILSWATKFFIDALILQREAEGSSAAAP